MSDREGRGQVDDEALDRYVRDTVSRYDVPPTMLGRGSPSRRRAGQSMRIVSQGALMAVAIILVGAAIRVGPFSQRGESIGVEGSSSVPSSWIVPASANASPSASPLSSESVGAVDLAAFAWFDLAVVGPCPPEEQGGQGLSSCTEPGAPVLATVILEAASLDGRHRRDLTFELRGVDQPADLGRARPFGFMGADGEVFYTANDERGGALRSMNLSTGGHEERFRSDELIQAAAYDNVDGTVIASYVSVDQRGDRGIWRINLATAAASRIVEPRSDLDISRRANGWTRNVWITPDSRRIVSLDCIDTKCEARVYDAETGALAATAAGLRDEAIYGVTDRDLIGVFDCPQQPCRISALELDNGLLRPLVSPCGYAVAALAAGSDAAAVLGVGAVGAATCDLAAVLAVETETGRSRTAWTGQSPTERQLQIIQRGPGLGYSAPAGWIALGPGGGFKPATTDEVADPILLDLIHGGVLALVTP